MKPMKAHRWNHHPKETFTILDGEPRHVEHGCQPKDGFTVSNSDSKHIEDISVKLDKCELLVQPVAKALQVGLIQGCEMR